MRELSGLMAVILLTWSGSGLAAQAGAEDTNLEGPVTLGDIVKVLQAQQQELAEQVRRVLGWTLPEDIVILEKD